MPALPPEEQRHAAPRRGNSIKGANYSNLTGYQKDATLPRRRTVLLHAIHRDVSESPAEALATEPDRIAA